MRPNRLICMVMAAAMFSAAVVASAAEKAYKEGDKGTFTGTVTEKGANWFRVKNDTGESLRFMPNWIGGLPKDGGGLDKAMVETIKGLKEGDKVEVEWQYIEHLRAIAVKKL